MTTGRSTLRLPVRPVRPDEAAVVLAPPRHGPAAPQTRLDEGRVERRATLDLLNGVATYETIGEGGLFGEGVVRSDETGTALSHSLRRILTIGCDDPRSATSRIDERYVTTGPAATVVIDVDVVQSADAHAFRIAGTLQVREDDVVVFERAWDGRVGRDGL